MSNALIGERTVELPLREAEIVEERTLAMGVLPVAEDEIPDEKFVRGRCPECGDYLVSNLYHAGRNGYVLRWECWESLRRSPLCHYFHVL